MKPKIINNFSFKENPFRVFSKEKNSHISRNTFFNFTESNKIILNKNSQDRLLTDYNRNTSIISSISKSLKSMTLNSKVYDKYIDYYSNLTQKFSFKTLRVDKYPLSKNNDYFPVRMKPLLTNNLNNEKISFSNETQNSLFLTYTKDIKEIKKYFKKNPYEFRNDEVKNKFEKEKAINSIKAGKDFGELCEKNLFESKFLNKLGIKKIDINNCFEEKQKNLKFFYEYSKNMDELKDILNENNFHRNIVFKGKTAIKKEKMEFKLDIYSLCFKFFSLSDNKTNKEKESQKLYFPFILMPLFYLLDFTSFKVLLSEIITFNTTNNSFEYIKEFLLINKVKKYLNFIHNSFENKNGYNNNITYNKKETIFPLIYDWIVAKHVINEEEEEDNIDINLNNNKNYKCFKLKLVLPKIKFSVDNLNLKINKFLDKHTIAYLLQNKFKNWEKFIFSDLFSIKKFKIITNLIMLNKYYKIPLKKINLSKKYKIQNKDYEFFLTQIGDNFSLYYIFIPFIVLIAYGEKEKKFQKINLNLKESINLFKFGQSWGIINTLFKCMFMDKMKNKIFFKFELIEDDKNELYNIFKEENNKTINKALTIENYDIDKNYNIYSIKKVQSRNKSIRTKEMNNIQARYQDNMYDISLLNCTFRKINITPINSEDKYYIIPQNMLNGILSIKDVNKIFNMNYTDIPIISKYIGENCKFILSARESNNISEEQKMIKQIEIEAEESKKIEIPKIANFEKQISKSKKDYNRLNTFQTNKKSNTFRKEENVDDFKVEKDTVISMFFPKEF